MIKSSATVEQSDGGRVPTAAEEAYAAIRSMIVNLQLRPGTSIIENDLIKELGIGRTPIREALGYLARDRMLHIYPRRAIVVAKLGVHEIQQIFEMRLIVEPPAARLAAERASQSEAANLYALTNQLRDAVDQIDASRFLEFDQEFHLSVATISRNSYLRACSHHILCLNLWLWNSYFASHGAHGTDLFTHERIVHAIANHDGSSAAAAMSNHIIMSKEHLLTGL